MWEYDVRVPVAGSLYTPRAQERGRCPSPEHLLKDWMDPGVYGHGITRHLSHTTNYLSTTFLLYFMAVTETIYYLHCQCVFVAFNSQQGLKRFQKFVLTKFYF